MKRSIVLRRLLVAAGLVALAASLAGVAHAGPAAPAVPPEIVVPGGHKPFLIGHAVGVQIHTCTATGWAFSGPRAQLYNDNGKLLTTHFSGPSWQARDGSLVKAALDGNGTKTVDPTAIPWLRLKVTARSSGADGDRLGATTYIQRVQTAGGLAPPREECDADAVGDVAEVPYTAVYVFWKATVN